MTTHRLQHHRDLPPAVAFRRSDCPHGRTFVRLPEEVGGQFCFGGAMLRVLGGSGYALFWAAPPLHAVQRLVDAFSSPRSMLAKLRREHALCKVIGLGCFFLLRPLALWVFCSFVIPSVVL
jgi:hypothetical protein